MAKLAIKKASTSTPLYLFIQNSSVSTGAGLTGLVFNSASLVAYYVRPLAAATAITLATQTVTGAFSSGGFVEVDATNMPGVYRFDVPDAAMATGVNSVVVMLKGATNMTPVVLEIDLVAYDPQSATNLGLSQVDAAVSSRMATYTQPAGFLAATFPVTVASTTNITGGTVTTATNVTTVNGIAANVITATSIAAAALNGKGDWNIGKTGYSLTQTFPANFADLAIAVTTGRVTVGTNADKTGYALTQTFPANFSDLAITVTTGRVTVGTNADKTGYSLSAAQTFDLTGSITGNLSGSVGSVTGAVGSVTGAVGSVTGLTASNLDTTVSSRATPAQILTTAMTESYAADGVAPTLSQAMFQVLAREYEFAISGDTLTAKKLDGLTTAMVFTLAPAGGPYTSITRST